MAQSNSMVMPFRHIYHRICGFQFHSESILTPDGGVLLKQTILFRLWFDSEFSCYLGEQHYVITLDE